MKYGEIVFSNDLCCAYITAIVKSFERLHPKGYLGRTAMQKLVYFCQVLGMPIPCRFEIYTYGPYSDKVTFSVESLLADGVVVDASKNPNYSNYRLGDNAKDLLAKFKDDIAVTKVDNVVRCLGGFDPKKLELIATIHYINARKKRTSESTPTRTEVIKEFLRIKGDKFPKSEVESWYKALEQANLL